MTNHVDYTAKDYLSLREQMVATAQDRLPEWTPAGSADFALAIIEATAYMGDILSYYTDRALNESFLATATQRSSVLDIARMLGYEPQGPEPATVTLSFDTDNASSDVTIPAGTQVATDVTGSDRNVVFETDAAVTATTGGASTVTVTATEGVTVEDEIIGTATTQAFQRYDLAQSPVDGDSIIIEVNEGGGYQQWVYFNRLLDADDNTPAYTYTRDAVGNVQIRFGDDVDGRIPAQGSPIRATYRVGGGAYGNVPAKTITNLLDAVAGVISVQNLDPASGGEDAERTDDIRANAPVATRTGNRAVTLRDFRDLASIVPGVQHASADADNATSVIVYVIPTGVDQPTLTVDLQTDVEEALATRALLGTTTTVQQGTYVPIDIGVTIHVEDGYVQSDVTTRVERAIEGLYDATNVRLGKTLPVSDLYRIISDVEGVLYLTVEQHERDYGGGGDVVTDPINHAINELPYLNDATVTPVGGVLS